MVDENNDEKETIELKTVYSLYLDKRHGILKNTHFKSL